MKLFLFCLANWIISTNKTSVNAATRLVFRILPIIRSSRPEVFCEKGVLRNFAKFTGKHAAPATLLKKRLCHRCFPVNFVKFLRTPFFTEHIWWLLLNHLTLREKCPNTDLFLTRIFLYSDWTVENTDQKKLRIWAPFTQCTIHTPKIWRKYLKCI